jgi:HEAT repeat protein
VTASEWGFTDRYAYFRFNETAWDTFRMAVLAMWPKNIDLASNWELLSVSTWHECPIARVTAADELQRRGVQT